jgi:hypothetical protein
VSAYWTLNRLAKSPDGAHALVTAEVFDVFPELLNSRTEKVREWTVEMMGALATHGFVFEQAHGHSPTVSSGSIIDAVSPSRIPLKYTHVLSIDCRYVRRPTRPAVLIQTYFFFRTIR